VRGEGEVGESREGRTEKKKKKTGHLTAVPNQNATKKRLKV